MTAIVIAQSHLYITNKKTLNFQYKVEQLMITHMYPHTTKEFKQTHQEIMINHGTWFPRDHFNPLISSLIYIISMPENKSKSSLAQSTHNPIRK